MPGSVELELLGGLFSMGTEDFRSGGVADKVNPHLHSLETFGTMPPLQCHNFASRWHCNLGMKPPTS